MVKGVNKRGRKTVSLAFNNSVNYSMAFQIGMAGIRIVVMNSGVEEDFSSSHRSILANSATRFFGFT